MSKRQPPSHNLANPVMTVPLSSDQSATPLNPITDVAPVAVSQATAKSKTGVIFDNNADSAQYRKSVDNLMVNNSPLALSNSQPAHAAILIEKFFEHAKRHVRIFSWKLVAVVFNDSSLCAQAEAALLRGVRISVIVQDTPEPSAFLDLLSRYPDSVVIRCTRNALMPFARTASEWLLNFAVMDERAYRLEQDRNNGKAQAVMNATEYAGTLIKFFTQVLQRLQTSTPSEAKA